MNYHKKLWITPWFGSLPEWFEHYKAQIPRLERFGFHWLIDTDLDAFKQRCKRILGVECPIQPGTGKLHNYRPALGLLYEEELERFPYADYWGHTDFDVVYGRLEHFIPDTVLNGQHIWTNDPDHICGPFTLYCNTKETRNLFREMQDWKEIFENPESVDLGRGGWSKTVEESGLTVSYNYQQSNDRECDPSLVHMDGDRLICNDREQMMYHFRLTKKWPLTT